MTLMQRILSSGLKRSSLSRRLLLLALIAPVIATAQGTTRYVNSTDATCGGHTPCYTSIQAAIAAAQAGDTLLIQQGTYTEQVSITGKNNTTEAVEADRITIEADPAAPVGSVVLIGPVSQCTNGWTIRLQQSKFITLRGLTITGSGGQAIELMGGNNDNQGIHLERNRIFGNGSASCNGGITVARGNPDTLIVNNVVYGNGRNGITFIDADGGPHHLAGNTIIGNDWNGVSVARNHVIVLANNLITGNGVATGSTGGRFGITRESSTNPNAAGIQLLKNLICGNRLGEINGPVLDVSDAGNLTPTGSEGPGVIARAECDSAESVYADLNGPDTLANTQDDDPTPAAGSPAIDAGLDPRTLGLSSAFNPLFESDLLAPASRPRAGTPGGLLTFDIGAIESDGVAPSDTVPPTVAMLEPAANTFVRGTVNVSAQASDGESGVAALVLAVDGQSLAATLTPTPPAPTVTGAASWNTTLIADGGHTLTATGVDLSGNSQHDSRLVTVDNTPPDTQIASGSSGEVNASSALFTFTGNDALTPVGNLEFAWRLDNGPFSAFSGATSVTLTGLTDGSHTFEVKARDRAGNEDLTPASKTFVVALVPPDPGSVAPPVDRTVATTFGSATAFLYGGTNPIQTGVVPGTIEARRAAVLRGRVLTRDGTPLPAVQITILGHPEYGTTRSRLDGGFDMAVNGGGLLTVRYEKPGFLPVQRPTTPGWQDYAFAPDVVLIPYDAQGTTIDLSNPAPIQVAQGGVVSDADGTRQATLLFRQGTSATLVRPDGTTQPLSTLTVRATEYTVGPDGPKAMPGPLPPNVGYTYAVEFSVDEGVAVGASRVEFSQPVIHYVENFLGFPVGGSVPTGFYDRSRGVWVPSDNGRVVQVLGVTSGRVDLDVDGSGTPADSTALASLAISDAERQQVAVLYQPGQSLWRVAIPHFTPWDCNWPYSPPAGATPPEEPESDEVHLDRPVCRLGSLIECQTQTLGEAIAVTGTAFKLHYQSDRTPGRKATRLVKLSGATIPSGVTRINMTVAVAGRQFTESFPPQPNQQTTFTWDGLDGYGRLLQGAQPITVRVGYVYGGVYQEPANRPRAFGAFSGIPLSINRFGSDVTLYREQHDSIGSWDGRAQGLGGWTIDVHHAYDPTARVLYLGNGQRRSPENISRVVSTIAGNGVSGGGGDGGPAIGAQFESPEGLTVNDRGDVLIADTFNNRIRMVAVDGTIRTVAGTGTAGSSGDGGPATNAQLNQPRGLAIDPEGNLLIADTGNSRVRRVRPDGTIESVAGNGVPGFSGDDGPATSAQLDHPQAVTADGFGNIYIADSGNARVRRVGADGTLTTVVGTDVPGDGGDGGPVGAAQLAQPSGLAVDPQGNLFIADTGSGRVRKVTSGGIVTTVVAREIGGGVGDAVPPPTVLVEPRDVALDRAGNLLIGDAARHQIWKVNADGSVTRAVGTSTAGYNGDGGPATSAQIAAPQGMAFDPQGALYVGDRDNFRVRKVSLPFPGFSDHEIPISADNGEHLHVFSASGRHIRTIDTLKGVEVFRFTYDGAGRLVTIEDVPSGILTSIERDPAGNPGAIVASGGQRTALALDGNGFLASVSNPAGESVQLEHGSTGLLVKLVDARGAIFRFAYDAAGRLTRHEDAGGGSKTLVRTENLAGYTVTLTTGLGRVSSYTVEQLVEGTIRRIDTDASGLQTVTETRADGTQTIATPDGTTIHYVLGPDPRFGMSAADISTGVVTTPSGLTMTQTRSRTVNLADPSNPLSMVSLADTLVVNGRTSTRVFDSVQRVLVDTSPAGRRTTTVFDSKGRVVREQSPGLEEMGYTYDTRGRLITATQGVGPGLRSLTIDYDNQDRAVLLTDPLGRTIALTYDLAERVTRITMPNLREVQQAYDANGNLTSLIPPGRPSHGFGYTSVDLEAEYVAPSVDLNPTTTTWTYDQDQKLLRVTLATGATIDHAYDAAGRLSARNLATGPTTYSYDPTTGKLSFVESPGGVVLSYAYDGRLLTSETWSGIVNGTVSRVYNNDFRLSEETVTGGQPVAFDYDLDGFLTQAGLLAIARHSQQGRVTGTLLGIVSDAREYSTFGELSQYRATIGTQEALLVEYTRDAIGRVTEKRETIGGVTILYSYSYDTAGRLIEVRRDGLVVAEYSYDANGNRLGHLRPEGAVTATYDAQDRLSQYGFTAYTYTADGALETKTTGAQTTTFQYDALGSLLAVVLPDGTRLDYDVDGLRRRIQQRVNGVVRRRWLYRDGLKPIAEVDGSTGATTQFVYGTSANVPDYLIRDGKLYRVLSDDLGSPRLVVDVASGAVAQRMDYDEFGRVVLDTNPAFQPFGFAGGLYDHLSGLVRFGHRDYDSETGRWTTKDPIGFSGLDTNLYAYVANDPINFADPTGLRRMSAEECRALHDHIQRKARKLERELARYDPIEDGIGGFKTVRGKRTKPGGHYEEIKNLQRSLNEELREYKSECTNRDDDNLPPYPECLEGLSRRPVVKPIRPLPDEGEEGAPPNDSTLGWLLWLLRLFLKLRGAPAPA